MMLFTSILRGATHTHGPRGEHIRKRIYETNGTYFYVPKASEFGYRLTREEATSIAERADTNMKTAQQQTMLAMILCVVPLLFGMMRAKSWGMPEAWSQMLPYLLLVSATVIGTLTHHWCLLRFEKNLEADLTRRPAVPITLLRDLNPASSTPKIIGYIGTLIVLPLAGLTMYAMGLPSSDSNRFMEKIAVLFHYIHLPLALLGVALAIYLYRKKQKHGF